MNWSVSVAKTVLGGLYTFKPNSSHSPEWSTWLINTLQSIQLPDLPDMWMCRGKAMHSCLCVCVCCVFVGKEILKNASSEVAKAFTDVSQRKTISIIRIAHFCTWCISVPDASPDSSLQCYFSYFLLLSMWPCSLTENISECRFVYHSNVFGNR